MKKERVRETTPLSLHKILIFGIILLGIVVFFEKETFAKPGLQSRYDNIIRSIASKYDVPFELIHFIIKAESNFNNEAVSSKGAAGLMQLMPATAKEYGVKNRFDPLENIEGGVKYLTDLMKLYDSETDLVLAAYNAGQEAVKKYGGIPPYRETRNYIKKIKRYGYDKDFISTRDRIYKYYDKNGRMVFTNDRNRYRMNTKNK